jgi:hypothetical protein
MSTGARSGGDMLLYVTLAGITASVVAFAAQKNFTINREAPEISTDAKGDTSVTNIPGRVNVTCSVDTLYVHGDSGTDRIIALMKAGTECILNTYKWDASAVAYAKDESANACITSINLVHADLEAATFSAEFDVNGDFS